MNRAEKRKQIAIAKKKAEFAKKADTSTATIH